MTDNELRRLSRGELIEIIYELQKQQSQLEEQLHAAQDALNDRNIPLKNAGSIAEAALQLNGVFEAAQAAADQFLASVHNANADAEKKLADSAMQAHLIVQNAEQKADAAVCEAQKKADAIVADAQTRAAQMVADAQRQADEKWAQVSAHAEELLNAHAQLQALFKGMELK